MFKHYGKKEIFSLFFACICMPATIVFFALNFWDETQLDLQRNTLLSQTESVSSQFFFHVDNTRFWAHLFNQATRKDCSGKDFGQLLESYSKRFKQELAYVIWPKNQKMIMNFAVSKQTAADWQKALPIVLKGLLDPGGSTDPYKDQFLRNLIGPHFFIRRINESRLLQAPNFVESDFRMKFPLVWANYNDKMTALIMLPPSIREKKQGLRKFCRDLLKDKNLVWDSFAVVQEKEIFGNSSFSRIQLNEFRQRMNASGQKTMLTADYLISGDELKDGSYFLTFSHHKKLNAGLATTLFILLQLFFALTLTRISAITRIMTGLRVGQAIFVLIGLSNILPLIFLVFFSNQYLVQKRIALLEKKRAEAIDFIQLLEQRFENEILRFPDQAAQTVARYFPSLRKGRLPLEAARSLHEKLVKQNLKFQLVASSTAMSLTNEGYLLDKSFIDLRVRQLDDQKDRTAEVFRKIATAYLGYWNNTPVSDKDLTEAELVVELLFQKPLDEAMHMFVEISDRIKKFGFGSNRLPSFSRIFSLYNPKKGDFFGFFQKRETAEAEDFLTKYRKERLGNKYGLKVIYCLGRKATFTGIAPFKDLPAAEKLLHSLKNYPPVSYEIVELEKQQYLSAGYVSSMLEDYSLMALFPVALIERQLATERYDLFALLAMNILLVLAMTYFFSEMLFMPVQNLEKCTQEIVAGNYSYRISDLGNDEMGRMGQVLNEALADLEELSVARLVQQQLFPQSQMQVEPFSLFGKSITLADLGGDYFDYFRISEEKFAVLLGDVAGHGVGAAMIMSMAKAATLNSADRYATPVAFLERLHQIVYLSKTRKQRKIMTLQYLCVNQTKRSLVYANAGGCNPFIVNGRTGKLLEIKLPGPVLGAFKKSSFQELEITFEPGDVMVLYTDGIAEARNAAGAEIGFDGLKMLLQQNYCPDPEKFYRAVYQEYCAWLGTTLPQDDLTMIFLALMPRA